MSRRLHLFVLAVCVCVASSDAVAMRAPTGFEDVDAFVHHEMERHGIVGLGIAIVRDGRLVHEKGFGSVRPGGAAVSPKTPFILGSMSKSFTALAVLQLVEAGRLELDAPVTRYLPWFRLKEPQERPITLRHLLHHTSGISPKAHAPESERGTLERQVRALASFAPVGQPGERHRYSSMNYLVLGLLVETVSGEPFDRYVERHVFDPLGMTSSFTSLERARSAGLSAGHRLWFGVPVVADLDAESDRLPTAGLVSSAEDLALYLSALMGTHPAGAAVVSARTREAIAAPGAPADGFSYAMGWRNGTTAGVPSLWHGGALPHYRGALVVSPGERWGVVVLSNLGSHFGDPTRAIASGISARLFERAKPSAPTSLKSISRLLGIPLAIWLTGAIFNLARVRRWRARELPKLAERAARRRFLIRTGVTLIWPIILVLGLPRALGLSLRAVFQALPDVTLGLLVIALLDVVLALLRLRMVRAAAARDAQRAF